MTTAEMLARLNDLRTAAGMKSIRAWKGSRAALEAAIAALPAVVPDGPLLPEAADVATEVGAPKSLADWCRENGINPKVARAKLRRAGVHRPYEANDATIEIIARIA